MAVIEVEVLNNARNLVVRDTTVNAVEIVSKTVIGNVVVSTTPPQNPFEGQIWIDIS